MVKLKGLIHLSAAVILASIAKNFNLIASTTSPSLRHVLLLLDHVFGARGPGGSAPQTPARCHDEAAGVTCVAHPVVAETQTGRGDGRVRTGSGGVKTGSGVRLRGASKL